MQKSVLVCIFALVCCNRYVFEEQRPGTFKGTQQEITINVPAQSDILFVVDNSGSMAQKIDRVRKNLISFVEKLRGTNNSFRLAITTTDNRDRYADGCANRTNIGAGADPVHDGVCGRLLAPRGKPAFIESSQFNSAAAMADAFAEYLRRDNDTINVEGAAVEQPLKSAARAVSQELVGDGKPNAGVFRKDALLLVVIVTDESDCSYDEMSMADAFRQSAVNTPPGASCYAKGSDLRSPTAWAADIVNAKAAIDGSATPRRAYVRAGLISGAAIDAGSGALVPSACRITNGMGTDACACFYEQSLEFCSYTKLKTPTLTSQNNQVCGVTGGDEGNCCTALANDRLFAFANVFDNLKDTICQPDFSATLVDLANLADLQCFKLDEAPFEGKPENIRITLRREGSSSDEVVPLVAKAQPENNGWYYDGDEVRACLSGTWKRKGKDTIKLFTIADVQSGPTGPTSTSN